MGLIEQQTYITERLTHFREFITTSNILGFYDINKLAEGFIAKLLSILLYQEDGRLDVLDKLKSDFPAIDLCDWQSSTAIQVTSDNSTDKIYSTIDKFIGLEEFQNHRLTLLRFFILNRLNFSKTMVRNIKKKYAENNIEYNDENSIMDIDMFTKKVRGLSEANIDKLIEIINNSLGGPKEQEPQYSFDQSAFLEFDKIINENNINQIVGRLWNAPPVDDFIIYEDIFSAYVLKARQHKGQFFDTKLQQQNRNLVKSILKLRSFLMTYYSYNNEGVHTLQPYDFDDPAETEKMKYDLIKHLNILLKTFEKEYNQFRGLVKQKFSI